MRSQGDRAGKRWGARLSGLADDISAWAESGGSRHEAGARGPRASERTCPYCIQRIDLLRCDVVSARRPGRAVATDSQFDNLERPATEAARGPGASRGHEILREARPSRDEGGWASLRGEIFNGSAPAGKLVPVAQLAPAQLMPRRVCEACGELLPVELDECDTRILAVVGVTGAGKTHFIAQAFLEASKRGSLRGFGCTEFAPTDVDKTAHALHNDYFTPVSREGTLLNATNPNKDPRRLIFTATVNGQRLLLLTHDIAGEALADPDKRAEELTFLRHADAMIFLLDPVEFDEVRRRLPAGLLGMNKPADQVHLLRQCLRELRQSRGGDVPVRVVVAKSDLLTSYCGVRGRWQRPAAGDWRGDIEEISEDVKRVLADLGEDEIIDVVREHERTMFHAVSSLGAPPEDGRRLARATPVRCSDPLGTALLGMVRQAAPRS